MNKGGRNGPHLIHGVHAVREALECSRPIHKVMLARDLRHPEVRRIVQLARRAGVPVQQVPRAVLDNVAEDHRGVVAVLAAFQYADLGDIIAKGLAAGDRAILVVLDCVMDPQNLGAIARCSGAAGVQGILLPKRRSVGLTAAVAKASAGALFHIPVARVTNLARTLEQLKTEGFWIYGAEAGEHRAHWEVDWCRPVCLVLGSEGKGLRRVIKERCDVLVSIPQVGGVGSLNVSVACGIILFEALRQRTVSGLDLG